MQCLAGDVRTGGPVGCVSNYRMADGGAVDSDLMCPAGYDGQCQKRRCWIVGQYFKMSQRRTADNPAGSHFVAGGWAASDGQIYGAGLIRMTVDNREVGFVDLPVMKHGRQPNLGFLVAGNQKQP